MVGVKQEKTLVNRAPVLSEFFATGQLTTETRRVLRREGLTWIVRRDQDEAVRRLAQRIAEGSGPVDAPDSVDKARRRALYEICVSNGHRLEEGDPVRAAGYWITAARFVWPYASGVIDSPKERRVGADAYNVACAGTGAALAAVDPGRLPTADDVFDVPTPMGPVHLSFRRTQTSLVAPVKFETVVRADQLSIEGLSRRALVPGIGGAMVALHESTEERRASDPNLAPGGRALPITVVLRFPDPQSVVVSAYDTLVESRTEIDGRVYPLEADYSAPYAVATSAPEQVLGLQALFAPQKFLDRQGLYALEPMRAGKIPLVFVHGLMSSPDTWRDAVNLVYADPVLRERFEVLVYAYPTGFPIVANAGDLRERLAEYTDRKRAAGMRVDDVVLVGHSMGGILSNMQIRDAGDGLWKAFRDHAATTGTPTNDTEKTLRDFGRELEELGVSEEQKLRLRDAFVFQANPEIDRVIFVCAPHRGSEFANSWLGRLGSRLVRYPFDLVAGIATANLEGLGQTTGSVLRTIVNQPPDSIDGLRLDNPILLTVLDLPVREGITMHSIVGDRGKKGPLEDSSDGIVPYYSSHLDRAVSERVVPAPHTATTHPDTLDEIRRILYLHLGRPEPQGPLPGAVVAPKRQGPPASERGSLSRTGRPRRSGA